jgi:hypothetical protein
MHTGSCQGPQAWPRYRCSCARDIVWLFVRFERNQCGYGLVCQTVSWRGAAPAKHSKWHGAEEVDGLLSQVCAADAQQASPDMTISTLADNMLVDSTQFCSPTVK